LGDISGKGGKVMIKVFVSYSFHDSEARFFIEMLRDRLRRFDFQFIDTEKELVPGENFQRAIAEKINQCNLFICFLDPKNPNVTFELGYALGKNKKILLVGDYREVPSDLKGMIYLSRNMEPYALEARILEIIHAYKEPSKPVPLYDAPPIESLKRMLDIPDLLEQIEYRDFERLIGVWFEARGYAVEWTGGRADYGFDFLIHPFRGDRAAIEVKRYKPSSQVSVSIVRQLVGAMLLEQIPTGIIVSTAPFTRSAMFFAETIEPKILLWTIEDMIHMEEMPNSRLESDEIR
jgi:HJR/Mrr/RecB family endonuclease